MTYTFEVFEKLLNRNFTIRMEFKSDSDFRLYVYSMYSGNWRLISKLES